RVESDQIVELQGVAMILDSDQLLPKRQRASLQPGSLRELLGFGQGGDETVERARQLGIVRTKLLLLLGERSPEQAHSARIISHLPQRKSEAGEKPGVVRLDRRGSAEHRGGVFVFSLQIVSLAQKQACAQGGRGVLAVLGVFQSLLQKTGRVRVSLFIQGDDALLIRVDGLIV